MAGDERAILEDTDGISKHVNVENPTPRRIRHAVEIAADADHAFMRHAAFETKRRLVGRKRQGLQRILFFCEGFVDDPPGRRMHARVGDRVEPMPELGVQILEVAERAAEEEVLADISERPLDFSLRFGSVWSAGARLEPIMPGQIDERAVADDEPVGILAENGSLHAVVEDFTRRAADRRERGHVATQHGLQILVQDEARPDQPGVAEHH